MSWSLIRLSVWYELMPSAADWWRRTSGKYLLQWLCHRLSWCQRSTVYRNWKPWVETFLFSLNSEHNHLHKVEMYMQILKIYRKFPKDLDIPKICCSHSKIWTMWLYHRVMSQNNADGMANSVDPDQTAPLWSWVCTVCPGISVRKLRIVRYIERHHTREFLKQNHTVMIRSFRTDRSGQSVWSQIRLLLEEQSDQGLHCLPFCLHFFGLLTWW